MNSKNETFKVEYENFNVEYNITMTEKEDNTINFLIKSNDFLTFKDKDVFEDFFINLTEGVIDGFTTAKEIKTQLIPTECEIVSSEGMFIDAYYENLYYNEECFLSGDGEIGKNLVHFSYDNKKDEISFDMSHLYWNNGIIIDADYEKQYEEYEESGILLERIKDEFREMFIDNIIAYA